MERTPRRARPALLAALVLAAPVTLTALPAQAAPPSYDYDALGDSYAAGFGVAEGQAYPDLLDGRMRIDLDDDASDPGAALEHIPAQLQAIGDDAELITVSIGGNDVGWSLAVGACVTGTDDTCRLTLGGSLLAIGGLGPALDATYAQIRAAAPDAHVVVTGYPRLFSPEHGAYLNASPAEQMAMNDGADLLNSVIEAAADRHGFQFVDVTERFDGHGVNAPAPWIFGIQDPGLFHPTAQGQRAYAAALTAAINPRDLRR